MRQGRAFRALEVFDQEWCERMEIKSYGMRPIPRAVTVCQELLRTSRVDSACQEL